MVRVGWGSGVLEVEWWGWDGGGGVDVIKWRWWIGGGEVEGL